MLANAGKCWQVLAYAGGFGGMRGAGFDFVRSLSILRHSFITPCSPSGAADLIAPRIPPGLGLWSSSSSWCQVGVCRGLLGGHLGPFWAKDCPKVGPRSPKMVPRWPQDDPKRPQDGPQMAQDGPQMAQDGPKRPQDEKCSKKRCTCAFVRDFCSLCGTD